MNYYFGPLSKNIVDTLINLTKKYPATPLTFIPSRRQIDLGGGYVNNWTIPEFVEYIKSTHLSVKVQRDHGGPAQGVNDDDGTESLLIDAKFCDIVHIDPWKKYQNLDEGIQETIRLIQVCESVNSHLEYEVATEEAIRYFSTEDLSTLLHKLKDSLSPLTFSKIKFVVIQCGTSLCEMKNTGVFSEERLKEMIHIVESFGCIPKEHNGDWVSKELRKKKLSCGLTHMNIAPELAGYESKILLDIVRNDQTYYNDIYDLCYASKKWSKWVSSDFVPEQNKDLLILSCLHYLYNTPVVLSIKSNYPNIDERIQGHLTDIFSELFF
jgi:hypothetical protein